MRRGHPDAVGPSGCAGSSGCGRAAGFGVEGPRLVEASRDRLRPAVLARKVLLPPVLAGAAVSCLLGALALTVASGSRADGPNPLARAAPEPREPLAIGLSLELRFTGFAGRLGRGAAGRPGSDGLGRPARAGGEVAALETRSSRLASLAATGRKPAELATPVAGVVGGCGTFGCPRPGHLHNGVDFLAAAGTPVHAAASGRVALVQSPVRPAGYGNFVCVQHRPALATCYAHLSAVAARVRTGALVRRGQVIGLVGATGSASTPHLHFEVRRGPAGCQHCAVDPLALLPGGAGGPRTNRPRAAATRPLPHPRGPRPASPRRARPCPHRRPRRRADPVAMVVEVTPRSRAHPPAAGARRAAGRARRPAGAARRPAGRGWTGRARRPAGGVRQPAGRARRAAARAESGRAGPGAGCAKDPARLIAAKVCRSTQS